MSNLFSTTKQAVYNNVLILTLFLNLVLKFMALRSVKNVIYYSFASFFDFAK